jgi:hypothetical protein
MLSLPYVVRHTALRQYRNEVLDTTQIPAAAIQIKTEEFRG